MSGVHRGIALPETESLFGGGVLGGLPDRDLLERFSANRDAVGELAFTALVARHGPMVLVVCRRMLRDPSDVDDAFQATFLVLARKAGSIRVADSLGPWLYGVSTRVARRLQGAASRRRTQCADEEWLQSVPDRRADRMSDLDRRWEIDETLATLPDAFRAALRLCYFEGLTHEEAAARLGCPVGTVRSRMARGRALLRRRLEDAPASRSTGVSAGPWEIGSGPPLRAVALVQRTAQAAARVAVGAPPAGVAPARVVTIATGVLETMSRTRLIAAASLVFAMTGFAALAVWAGQSAPSNQRNSSASAIRPDGAAVVRPAVAQAKSGSRRNSSTGDGQGDPKRPGDLPPDFPAFVVETQPRMGDIEVDAAVIREIRVVFSKPMTDSSWSLTQGNAYAFPQSAGAMHYLADRRTCVIPVKLEPGKTYAMGINGGRFNNFKDADGKPALPTSLAFRTRKAK